MIPRVDFVTVPVRDAARSRAFYTETLGLALDPGSGEYETANVTLTPWQPEADGEAFTPNRAGIALRVEDVHAERERLERLGVPFLGPTVDTGVCLMAFLHDPDGNVLILHRRYAPHGVEPPAGDADPPRQSEA